MKYFYKCTCKTKKLNSYITVVQNTWFYVLPSICLFAEGKYGTLGKIRHMQIEWLYWGIGINFFKEL